VTVLLEPSAVADLAGRARLASEPNQWPLDKEARACDFPGGTVDLRYRFTLADGLITELVIAP
jgi:hypothetical protein